jgi:integrase
METEMNGHTFTSQAPIWLAALDARRKPVAPATIYLWSHLLQSRILPVIGSTRLADFDNGALRQFIDHLCSLKLAPRTVRDVVLVTKNVIASATDANGNFLYPRVWNQAFLNMPPVEDSEMPCPDSKAVSNAVRLAPPRWSRLIAVLAGTGLRIGELASLRTLNDGQHSYWNGKDILHVKTSIWHGQDVNTKTSAGVRDVFMCSALVKIVAEQAKDRHGFLFGRNPLVPIATQSAARALRRFGIQGFHSLRRFRVTVLRASGCPESILRVEIGHARTSITDLYDKSARNEALRREWAQRVGLGFVIPKRLLGDQQRRQEPTKFEEVTQPVSA